MAIDDEWSDAKLPAIRNLSWADAPEADINITTIVHKHLPTMERIMISSLEWIDRPNRQTHCMQFQKI
jgi:hypothetical protein